VNADRLFTLLVFEQAAILMAAGACLATLDCDDGQLRVRGGGALDAFLPPNAQVQILFAHSRVQVLCRDVPALTRRELQDVKQRLAESGGFQGDLLVAHALETDPQAEGGRVLWLIGLPRAELARWLEPLKRAGARPMFAMAWQRAFLGAEPGDPLGRLYLALLPGAGHLLFFRGASLGYQRMFPLPQELDAASADGIQTLDQLATEELSRHMQFIRQKFRGKVPSRIHTVGMPDQLKPAAEAIGQSLGLPLEAMEPDLAAFLLAGAERERRRKGGMNLIPEEDRPTTRQKVSRVFVWIAAVVLALIGLGTWLVLQQYERSMEREAGRAEAAMAPRLALAQEGEQAARARFPLLRLRRAEQRQKEAIERVEQLALRVFQVPDEVELHKVEILQVAGDGVSHRFTLDGAALTRESFSMGSLAKYFTLLAGHPGVRLEPLREVTVLDRPTDRSSGLPEEQAITRFRLEGSAP
jgi:hypothetical protein